MLTRPAGHEAEAEASKSDAEAEKFFRGRGHNCRHCEASCWVRTIEQILSPGGRLWKAQMVVNQYSRRAVAVTRPRLTTKRLHKLTTATDEEPLSLHSERKCADTIGTVLVPLAGHFQC